MYCTSIFYARETVRVDICGADGIFSGRSPPLEIPSRFLVERAATANHKSTGQVCGNPKILAAPGALPIVDRPPVFSPPSVEDGAYVGF